MGQGTALITGASSGIGAEFARQLARDGVNLVLVARRADRLEGLRKAIESETAARCRVIPNDLSRRDAPREVWQELQIHDVKVDWLVNNAGFGTNGFFASLPLEREIEEVQLNVGALVALTRLCLPGMVKRRAGHIVNLGSVGSWVPTPYMATYSATKAFVLSFSEALAIELAGTGVRVLALCPGATETEFQQVAGLGERVPKFTYMSAQAVVRQALAAAKSGKRTLVPGWMNKLLIGSARLTPRRVLAHVAGSMFTPKGEQSRGG
jgi:short-subunit dehydrogenase